MHSVTKSMQQGFTLIELMIVVAIIAILAAIAIPQYEHYIARSQFSEALTMTDGLKTDVIDYWDQNGALPAAASTIGVAATKLEGKYVGSVLLNATGIQAKFKTKGVSAGLNGQTVQLEPGTITGGTFTVLSTGSTNTGAITWQCSTTVVTKAPEDVPSACNLAPKG